MKTIVFEQKHEERISRAKMQSHPKGSMIEVSDKRADEMIAAGVAREATAADTKEADKPAAAPKGATVKVENVKG